MNKIKKGVFLSVILLVVFSLNIISADTCTIQSSCNQDNTVLKLSSQTNAHAELYDETNYDYYLCCDFTGTHSSTGNNKVLGLSSSTNAHVEVPNLDNYATSAYFGELECAKNADSCPSGYDIEMVSVSADTNAHIAKFDYYSTKVCCKNGGVPLSQAYWADPDDLNQAISYIEISPGNTPVALVVKNVSPPSGTTSFEIYEDDLVSDDEIRTGANSLSGDVNGMGVAVGTWTITQEDLDKTSDLGEFYFLSNSQKSNNLAIAVSGINCIPIQSCEDYTTEGDCTSDLCTIEEMSVNNLGLGITCGEGYNCDCTWDSSNEKCKTSWTQINTSESSSGPINLGTCSYNENTADDCEDGFLTYSWGVSIIWPADNNFTTQQECINQGGDLQSCVFFNTSIDTNFDNKWHYDPLFNGANPLLTQCLEGSNTLECPAQIQLGFFTSRNFIGAIIIIAIIYIAYALQKKNNKKKKKKTKKKKKA